MFVTNRESVAKQSVHKVQNLWLTAEVHSKWQSTFVAHLAAQRVENRWLGAPESVNRWLEVADKEQSARFGPPIAEQLDEIRLQLIGILKLVDKQKLQVSGQPLLQFGVFWISD